MDESVTETERKIANVHLSVDGDGGIEVKTIKDIEGYRTLIVKAKLLIGKGRIEDALRIYKRALEIYYSEKLARKIKKMEAYLKEHHDDSEDDNGMVHLREDFYMYKDMYRNLYAHQEEGVLWMWSLYRCKKGGILGDDMGLGKTIQVIAFLSGMFDMQKIKSVLIVLPVAVIVNWEKELEKWAPGLKVVAYHGSSKREKERVLKRVQKRGGICLTTYGLVITSYEQLGHQDDREFVWDYMILDEGHKIKNPTKTSKGVHAIPAKHRLILTGTPVQNNLKELWALFDFVHQGSLLGTQRTFKMQYENPITRAREKDATIGEKKLGIEMAESLKEIIAPYFLRRTKTQVKQLEIESKKVVNQSSKISHAVMPAMMRKNDLIVWTFLSDTQLAIYQDFLSLDSVKELLMTTKSPLVALTVLKKICDHPRLLSTRACAQLGIAGDEDFDEEMLETEAGNLSAVMHIQHVADEILIHESGKLVFLLQLLDHLKNEHHRCLVFSQSRKMLDIMEKVMTNKGHKIIRLDGTIAQIQERERRIQKFQTDFSYNIFLLTTQVGGVGLTLTAADRVVIYDPSWNPATDAQAVDRVFRIGQVKNVVVYRLITCGTVEEKIYRRQIFKDSITRQTTGNSKNPYRYFSKFELRELFTLDDPKSSSTQQQLATMHSGQRLTDPSLDEHIAYLYSLEMFGLSDHDLMFSQGEDAGDHQDEVHNEPENSYIQNMVQKARELIQMESSQMTMFEERISKYPSQTHVQSGSARNQFTSWVFPKPDPQFSKDVEVEEDHEYSDSTSESTKTLDSIDLTSSPVTKKPVAHYKKKIIACTASFIDDQEHGNKTENLDLANKVCVKDEPSSMAYHSDKEMIPAQTPPLKIQDKVLTDASNLSIYECNEMSMEFHSPVKLPLIENVISGDSHKLMSMDQMPKHETPKKSMSSYILKTPNKDKSIVVEEFAFSPDASRPIIQIQPQAFRHFSSSSLQDFKPDFNSTIFGAIDTPKTKNHPNISSSGNSPCAMEQDSPISRHAFHLLVEDSPVLFQSDSHGNKSRYGTSASINKNISKEMEDEDIEKSYVIDDSMMISDSDDKEYMEQGNISVCDIGNIQKSLRKSTDEVENSFNDSPVVTKCCKSYILQRRIISSDEDSPVEYNSVNDNLERVDIEKSNNVSAGLEGDFEEDNSVGASSEDGEIEKINENDVSLHSEIDVEQNESGVDACSDYGDIEQNSIAKVISTNDDDNEQRYVHDTRNADNARDIDENLHGELTGKDGELEESEESEEDESKENTLDFNMLSEENQTQYYDLVDRGRLYCKQKKYEDAQACLLQALEIFPDMKLQANSIRLQAKIVHLHKKAQMINKKLTHKQLLLGSD